MAEIINRPTPRTPMVSAETREIVERISATGRQQQALTAAADKVDRLVEPFTRMGFPWAAVHDPDHDGDWMLATMPSPISGNLDPEPGELESGTPCWGGHLVDEASEPFVKWAAMMGGQVGGSVSALLRGLAKHASSTPGDVLFPALAFAVELLHTEPEYVDF